MWHRPYAMAREITKAYEKGVGTSLKQNKWVQWRKPPPGSFVLNTDGAVKQNTGQASAVGLIRDDSGSLVCGFAMNIGITDSLTAELWGRRR